jgi:aspartyl-tRNA(Asn)/glutamyl-tRNA(Gln) amidotransferase subunit A
VDVNRRLTDLAVHELAAAFRDGGPTPVDAARAALARADDVAHLGAFELVDADGALAQAVRAAEELAEGVDRGPLHGIPVAVKDVLAVAGLPLTGSSRALDAVPARADADAVARLREAGAVVLGTTRTHELAFGFTTPGTRNPHDTGRIAGGSSGGSAAAVAAGVCRVALGTDTAGSVRNPAALCGVVGLKPTYDLVSREGMLPLSWSLDHVGVLAATAGEAALALDAMGARPDRSTRPGPPASGLRIGVPVSPHGRIAPGVAAAVEQARTGLEELGHVLVPVALPHPDLALAAGFTIILSEAAARHGHLLRERREGLTDETAMLLGAGERLPASTYAHALRVRGHVQAGWRDVFTTHDLDLVATPTLPITAPAVGTEVVAWPDGAVEPLVPLVAGATIEHDMTGLPSASVPCGAADGLPVGLMLTGRPYGERTVLAVAAQVAATSSPVGDSVAP